MWNGVVDQHSTYQTLSTFRLDFFCWPTHQTLATLRLLFFPLFAVLRIQNHGLAQDQDFFGPSFFFHPSPSFLLIYFRPKPKLLLCFGPSQQNRKLTEPNRTEPPDAHPTHNNNQINGHTDNNVDDTSPSKNSHRMKPTPRFSLIFPHQPRKKKKKKKKKKQRREYTEKGYKDFESLEIEMACTSQSMISANSCSFLSHQRINLNKQQPPRWTKLFSVSASPSSSSEEECNVEECAPEKEVGKVSMEWLAGEKTKVAGTFPPKKRGWTGYIEKDTAGQTNIYSVEPAVYVAESVVSSGSAGTSSEGAENTAAIAAGLALISIAAASSILLQVDKKAPQIQNVEYSGPPLSYYINEFKPATIVQAATEVTEPQSSPVEAADASVPSETLISSEGNADIVVPEVEVVSKEVEAVTSSVSDGS